MTETFIKNRILKYTEELPSVSRQKYFKLMKRVSKYILQIRIRPGDMHGYLVFADCKFPVIPLKTNVLTI